MENRNYTKYSPDLEKIPNGEAGDILAVAKQINDVQRTQFSIHRRGFTGTHIRTQGIIRGKFIVPDNFPAHLKQGELFAQGGEYEVATRYSTEPSDVSIDLSTSTSPIASRSLWQSCPRIASRPHVASL